MSTEGLCVRLTLIENRFITIYFILYTILYYIYLVEKNELIKRLINIIPALLDHTPNSNADYNQTK